jgi:hypothetical protein
LWDSKQALIQYLALQDLASGAIIKLMSDGLFSPSVVAAWLML